MTDIPEVNQLRAEVAACTRILNLEGLMDYSGHVGARLPDGSGILIQPYERSRAAVLPEDLMICDWNARPMKGRVTGIPPREIFIHTEIMAARPDVNAVAHFHPQIATVFTLVENHPIVPVKNHASRWAEGIPVHPDPAHINSPDSGRALARTLGQSNAALIRAHGVVLTAESVPALLVDSVHFEENSETLLKASALGKVIPLSPDEIAAFLHRFDRHAHVAKLWKYYLGRAIDGGAVPGDWLR